MTYDRFLDIVVMPFGVLVYSSGLFLWPARRWRRGEKMRGKALLLVFLAQLVCYKAVSLCMPSFPHQHFYGHFIVISALNIAFTFAGVIAWRRDDRYERSLEASRAA
jgi:hypothetical protein